MVKETKKGLWKIAMLTKSAMKTCRSFEQEIPKEKIYNNSRGSSVVWSQDRSMADQVWRDSTLCSAGGEEEGTTEHLILVCKGLHLTVQGNGAVFFEALGFKDSEGKIYFRHVEITKRTLSDWWLQSRQEWNLVFDFTLFYQLQLGGMSCRPIRRVQPHPYIVQSKFVVEPGDVSFKGFGLGELRLYWCSYNALGQATFETKPCTSTTPVRKST